MSRYTALKTALYGAAIGRPVLLMAMFRLLTSQADLQYVLYCALGLLMVSLAPALCQDPVMEEASEAAAPPPGFVERSLNWIRPACVYLGLHWLFHQPEALAFLSALSLRLSDWRIVTCVALYCVKMLITGLAAARRFRLEDLYPHLRRESTP